VSVEHLLDVRFPHGADLLVDHLASLEYQESGDAANLVTTRSLHIRIHIQLATLALPAYSAAI